jgi:hypothetical protein
MGQQITGLHGRVYRDGKRVEQVAHPETRSGSEIRAAARAANEHKQPSGQPSEKYDPGEIQWAAEAGRHNLLWVDTPAGQRMRKHCDALSSQYAAERDAQRAADEHAAKVQPMVDHSLRTLAEAEADETITVAELETLRANVELARAGAPEYIDADKAWRQTQQDRLVEKVHAQDAILAQHRAERDRLAREAFAPEPDATEPMMVDVYYPEFYHDKSKAGRTISEPLTQ